MKWGLGFSFLEHQEKRNRAIERLVDQKIKLIFTTINSVSENVSEEEIYNTLKEISSKNIDIILDINNESLEKYSIEKIKEASVKYLRIDDGIPFERVRELADDFSIVLNASTVTVEDIKEYQMINDVVACYNYYPKRYTGQSCDFFWEQNQRFMDAGIKIAAFVAGDSEKRGPLYDGLPTLECDRNDDTFINALELMNLETDIVLVGDLIITEETAKRMNQLQEGFIECRYIGIQDLDGMLITDRKDCAFNLIRDSSKKGQILTEHWENKFEEEYFDIYECAYDEKTSEGTKEKLSITGFDEGQILYSNEKMKRYEGEIEITRTPLPKDDRRTIIGKVISDDIEYLFYISNKISCKLVRISYL